MKLKKLLLNWKILLLAAAFVLLLVALNPNPFTKGVAIVGIASDSPAAYAGMESPKRGAKPMTLERIIEVNGVEIKGSADWHAATQNLTNATLLIRTTKRVYRLENVTQTGIRIAPAPKSNLKLGMDLVGGTRAMLAPAEEIDRTQLEDVVAILERRLNEFGIADIRLAIVEVAKQSAIAIELAGIGEEEVRELLLSTGKFEARIGNQTVFRGGLGGDITYVCRTATCSGIDPRRPCTAKAEGWSCGFAFSVTLRPEAAARQAELTRNLEIVTENGQRFLSEQLVLLLDDREVDRLNIAADLRGRAVTDVQITGSGFGPSQRAAMSDTLEKMRRLQTILITGSLPVKLKLLSLESISPTLGIGFSKSAALAAALAFAAVALLLLIAFRNILLTAGMLVTSLIEILSILGIAALISWNIDLASIAGIILAIGTGIDDQIIITYEIKRKELAPIGLRAKIARAFRVIISAFATTAVAMTFLFFAAGAVFIKGFALTTLIGITTGILLTRPAYAAAMEILLRKD